MQATIYTKGANGLPGSTRYREFEWSQGEFSHGAQWGPLDSKLKRAATVEEAFWYAENCLGNPLLLRDDAGDPLWWGYVWAVSFQAGSRKRRRTLESYANRIRVMYTETDFASYPPRQLGQGVPAVANNTTGQGIYGTIVRQLNQGQLTTTGAQVIADAELEIYSQLLYGADGGSAGSSVSGAPTMEIEGIGWYRTLSYEGYTAALAGTADIGAIVEDVLGDVGQFLTSDYSQIPTVGISVPQAFQRYELGGEVIKKLLKSTDYVFGVDVDRNAYLRQSHRADTEPTYYEMLDGLIYDAYGRLVPLERVRPDALIRQRELVPISLASSAAIETLYMHETTWRSPGRLTYRAVPFGGLL